MLIDKTIIGPIFCSIQETGLLVLSIILFYICAVRH